MKFDHCCPLLEKKTSTPMIPTLDTRATSTEKYGYAWTLLFIFWSPSVICYCAWGFCLFAFLRRVVTGAERL